MPGPVIEKRDKKHYVRWGEREFGPFLREENDLILAGPDVRAVMGFIRRGREKPRRCVICIWIGAEDRRVFFSANNGETLEDAIEVIDAEDTGTGVWAEHQYMRLVLAGRNLKGEFIGQRLIPREGRHYDQLIYKTGKRRKFSLFFDITSFYGKNNETE